MMHRVQRTPPKEKKTNLSHVQSEPDILHSSPNQPEIANVCVRPKRPRLNSSPELDHHQPESTELVNTIRQEIRAIISAEISTTIKQCIAVEFNEMKDLFRELKESVKFMSDDYDRIKSELKICSENSKSLSKENVALKQLVSDLSVRVNLIEQYSRQQNIEINGVPENKVENLVKTVVQLGNAVATSIREEDIFSAVRVRKFDPENRNPRAVIVKLRTTQTRDVILTSVMKFNKAHPTGKLNSQHLGYGGPPKPIYVSEHLSPVNKQIYAATRKAATEKGYKYVWVRDGKVLTRKADGEQAKHIRSLDAVALL
ncbi:hypothetical protein PYW07_008681 [Mythimna separata]|uniref:FP protein C-terminal domain-containing protein n=1 Tax=Mythimna separata TaxID=271217 RepID=A0AAD8DP94_MYTSE|nr:hypothetical protein PYW07_008681 [Mythimna separata]